MKTNRMVWHRRGLIALGALLAGPVSADRIGDSNELLCYGMTATVCTIDGATCETKEPWELNLPDFVDVDLRAKLLKSTPAAQESRETPIARVERDGGYIFLQGSQGERAFSWVIAEQTGEGSIMINSFDTAVTVFTVCTVR